MKKTMLLLTLIALGATTLNAAPFLVWDPPIADDEVTEHMLYEWKLDGTYVPIGAPILMPNLMVDLGALQVRKYRLVIAGVNIWGEGPVSDPVSLPASVPRKPGKPLLRKK